MTQLYFFKSSDATTSRIATSNSALICVGQKQTAQERLLSDGFLQEQQFGRRQKGSETEQMQISHRQISRRQLAFGYPCFVTLKPACSIFQQENKGTCLQAFLQRLYGFLASNNFRKVCGSCIGAVGKDYLAVSGIYRLSSTLARHPSNCSRAAPNSDMASP
jgi:hypothetical protein